MDFSKMKYKKFFHFQGVQNASECEYLMRGYFPGRWSLPGKPLYRPLTNAGSRASESMCRNHGAPCQPYPAVQIH